MKQKQWVAAALSAMMVAGLAACGSNATVNQPEEEVETPAVIQTAETDASAYASGVDNANIDAAVYLDYSAGMEAGVYRWIPSDDGAYYTLAAVDADGEPLTAEESAINVGANNAERGGGFSGGGMPEGADGGRMSGGGMRGGMGFGAMSLT